MEEESDTFQTWWEIPSIVHLCNTLSTCVNDIYPITIERFEKGFNDNSNILMNIAIRFVKVCGFYDPHSNKWWDFMKKLLNNHCPVYNFENPIDEDASFNDLSPRKQVEVLYILGHLILDVEKVQETLNQNSEVLSKLNVKPLGYDVNKSVYWYFGGTRLYREDYDLTYLPDYVLELINPESNEIMTNLNEKNDNSCDINDASDQTRDSIINNSYLHEDVQKNLQTKPYPSGILGSGKWNMICDDDESWHYLTDTTEYSRNFNVKLLHRSLNKITLKLPTLKRNKPVYQFIKYTAPKSIYHKSLASNPRVTRSRQSAEHASENNHFDEIKNENHGEIAKKDNFNLKTLQVKLIKIDLDSKYSSMFNVKNLKENVLNEKPTKLKLKDTNRLLRSNSRKFHEDLEFKRTKKDHFDKESIVAVERCGQENVQNVKRKNTKLITTQKRFRTHAEMQVSPLKDVTSRVLM
ncbi:chromatin remodeling regulator CECR2-like isoform X2 [Daktulosphaira vitifoliae]|uniref:chromatin remodeling regulator CECR2-like isoform X2 n=1 Tax=Daktulosphaira vitifoliae TaxID=58002 RepID=UPI0021AA2F50|nr:chromatin remodeling regulator CECR2-like isoform X2 [Daktulosphaira vitifoliae]